MGFKKYSTVPLEMVADDQGQPDWVKEAHKDEEKEDDNLMRSLAEKAINEDEKNGD